MVDGRVYPAAINCGPNPTFGEGTSKLEVHLIGFCGELYGQSLEVEWLDRLRGVQKFSGADALLAQVKIDLNRTTEIAAATAH